MKIDNANVIKLSKKGDYGVIRYVDDEFPPIQISYLAICKYEASNQIYLFFCNDHLEVEQDNVYETEKEALNRALKIRSQIEWDDSII